MQTNGIGGGRQHEVSEKLVNRGTFPCRLDMELCETVGGPAAQACNTVAVHQPEGQAEGTGGHYKGTWHSSQGRAGRTDHLRELRSTDGAG